MDGRIRMARRAAPDEPRDSNRPTEWPVPEDELDERDPKERAGAEIEAPAVAESPEEVEGDFADDGPDEAAPEAEIGRSGVAPPKECPAESRSAGAVGVVVAGAQSVRPVAGRGGRSGGRESPRSRRGGRREPSSAGGARRRRHGDPQAPRGPFRAFSSRRRSSSPNGAIRSSRSTCRSRGPRGRPPDRGRGRLRVARRAPSSSGSSPSRGCPPADYRSKYVQFHKGISVDPDRRLRMETSPDEISGRVLDLVVPIGRGPALPDRGAAEGREDVSPEDDGERHREERPRRRHLHAPRRRAPRGGHRHAALDPGTR